MKAALFIAISMLFTQNLLGQETVFGFRGGVNLAKPSFGFMVNGSQTVLQSDFGIGYYAGAYTNLGLWDYRSELQIELTLHSTKLSFANQSFDTLALSGSGKLVQLDLPIFFKWRPVDRLFIVGGFYGGFILNKKDLPTLQFRDTNTPEVPPEVISFENDLNKFDAGLVLGAEYQFKNSLFLEVRYAHGLVDLITSNAQDLESSLKNRNWQLGIGYQF